MELSSMGNRKELPKLIKQSKPGLKKCLIFWEIELSSPKLKKSLMF